MIGSGGYSLKLMLKIVSSAVLLIHSDTEYRGEIGEIEAIKKDGDRWERKGE